MKDLKKNKHSESESNAASTDLKHTAMNSTAIEKAHVIEGVASPRRQLLTSLGVGITGAIFSAACGVTKFTGTDIEAEKAAKDDGDGNGDPTSGVEPIEAKPGDPKPADPKVEPPCNPLAGNKLDLSKIANESGTLIPHYKLYGAAKSCLLVVDLDGYTYDSMDKPLERLIVCHPDGKKIAIHMTNNADIKSDKKLRYFLFDNLNLKTSKRLAFVFVRKGNIYTKHEMAADFTFENTYDGKNVVSINTNGPIPSAMAANQALMDFQGIEADGFVNNGANYAFPGGRNLYTAQSGAKFERAKVKDFLAGFVILDLMGKPLETATVKFTDILETPCFVALKESNGVYYRTILRAG